MNTLKTQQPDYYINYRIENKQRQLNYYNNNKEKYYKKVYCNICNNNKEILQANLRRHQKSKTCQKFILESQENLTAPVCSPVQSP
tara:strand:+ start:5993 stop:6250 length:258 start_codon:yes stop_codon:yes gene_type:complete